MTSRFLPVFRDNADVEIEAVLPVVAGAPTLDQVARLCRNYRRRGICGLFLEGLPRLLHADLRRSGTAWLYFLGAVGDDAKATGHGDAFFDAVACHDLTAAAEIARRSRTTWHEGEEIEDDYLYLRFLMQRAFLGASLAEMTATLDRYETVLEGVQDLRFGLCRALADGDAGRFDDSLRGLLAEREVFFREGAASEDILEEEWATDGQLFVEGLALVAIAERLGLPTAEDYLLIPSIARPSRPMAFDADAWRSPGG